MPVHEFGIINSIENGKSEFDYDPLKYNCISVDDEIINSLYDQLSIMKPISIHLTALSSD